MSQYFVIQALIFIMCDIENDILKISEKLPNLFLGKMEIKA